MYAVTEDLVELAEICTTNAKLIKDYLSNNGHPQMSFKENGPAKFPQVSLDVEAARAQLRTAARRLYDLASGPEDILCWAQHSSIADLAAFRYVYNHNIADAVPNDSSISYNDLATRTGTDPTQLRQFVRQLMTIHVFSEPQRGRVSHTASSKLLTDRGYKGWNAWECEDLFPIAVHHIDALKKWGHGSPEPTQAAVQIAFDTTLNLFPYYETDPPRKERLMHMLQTASRDDNHHVRYLTDGFDWPSLGPVTLVDLGGNTGHASAAIATAAPEIQCIVQDLPQLIKIGTDPRFSVIPNSVKDRVTLMGHNFFEPQPAHVAREADVYFIRNVLHNWSTPYCRKILGNVVAALRQNSKIGRDVELTTTTKLPTPEKLKRIIIQDEILPLVGSIPLPTERVMRSMDTGAAILLNAQSRDLEEWRELLASVDERLRIVSVAEPNGAATSIIEVVLDDDGGDDKALGGEGKRAIGDAVAEKQEKEVEAALKEPLVDGEPYEAKKIIFDDTDGNTGDPSVPGVPEVPGSFPADDTPSRLDVDDQTVDAAQSTAHDQEDVNIPTELTSTEHDAPNPATPSAAVTNLASDPSIAHPVTTASPHYSQPETDNPIIPSLPAVTTPLATSQDPTTESKGIPIAEVAGGASADGAPAQPSTTKLAPGLVPNTSATTSRSPTVAAATARATATTSTGAIGVLLADDLNLPDRRE